jgi:hypothetical protein
MIICTKSVRHRPHAAEQRVGEDGHRAEDHAERHGDGAAGQQAEDQAERRDLGRNPADVARDDDQRAGDDEGHQHQAGNLPALLS